jgi:hypothetical protein
VGVPYAGRGSIPQGVSVVIGQGSCDLALDEVLRGRGDADHQLVSHDPANLDSDRTESRIFSTSCPTAISTAFNLVNTILSQPRLLYPAIMDFLKNAASQLGKETSGEQEGAQQQGQEGQKQQGGLGGLLGGLKDKANSAAGGGPESEKSEDYLDK